MVKNDCHMKWMGTTKYAEIQSNFWQYSLQLTHNLFRDRHENSLDGNK